MENSKKIEAKVVSRQELHVGDIVSVLKEANLVYVPPSVVKIDFAYRLGTSWSGNPIFKIAGVVQSKDLDGQANTIQTVREY